MKILSIFLVLGNWTEQGIKNIKEAPKRAIVAKDMVEKAGGKMQTFYTLGEYDFVSIIELPKEDDIIAILLCLGSMGNVRTKTLKAWSELQVTKVLSTPHP